MGTMKKEKHRSMAFANLYMYLDAGYPAMHNMPLFYILIHVSSDAKIEKKMHNEILRTQLKRFTCVRPFSAFDAINIQIQMDHLTFNSLPSNAIFHRLIDHFITHQHNKYARKHTKMATLQQSAVYEVLSE